MEIYEKRKKLKDLYGKHAKEWRRKVSSMTSKQVYAIYESMKERGYFDKQSKNGKKVELVKNAIKKDLPHQFDMFELGLLKEDIDMYEDKIFVTKDDGTVVVQHPNKLADIVGNAMSCVSNISATPGSITYTRKEAETALKELGLIYQEIVKYDQQR